MKKADKWFSYFIRVRDSDDNGFAKCCTCGTIKHWKQMDCGHYVKRQHQGVRYNEMNCHAQCRSCNWLKQGNDAEYKEFIIEKYGKQNHDLLKSFENKSFKRSKFEFTLIAKEYKKKYEELIKYQK
jgi:6-phosphogluconate dehydrogenase (decarboxylating)